MTVVVHIYERTSGFIYMFVQAALNAECISLIREQKPIIVLSAILRSYADSPIDFYRRDYCYSFLSGWSYFELM